MEVQFLGATGTVTGSKYLIRTDSKQILVDCGLFQGYKELRLRNWAPLPVSPKHLDAVILTHAHLDHSGYLPVLIKEGFRGKIFASAATRDLCKILLPDSGYLQEEDAARANRYRYSKHKPALPLYTKQDAEVALQYFECVEFGQEYEISDGLRFHLSRSGHILGSSFIYLRSEKKSLLFTGDLGRSSDSLMKAPTHFPQADYLVVESTYGNRLHDDSDPLLELAEIINQTIHKGGSILIPAFAVGRSQSLLYYLNQLKYTGMIPESLPVFLDSPMAINATHLLCKYPNEHRLSPKQCEAVCHVAKYINTVEDSKALMRSPLPSVIISASGMATGGRVLHHLKNLAPDHKNTILFTGFQATGTRGSLIIQGAREVKIHGGQTPIHARIEQLNHLSAHADYNEILTWLSYFKQSPKKVFITHGEAEASKFLKSKIEEAFDWNVSIPEYLQKEQV